MILLLKIRCLFSNADLLICFCHQKPSVLTTFSVGRSVIMKYRCYYRCCSDYDSWVNLVDRGSWWKLAGAVSTHSRKRQHFESVSFWYVDRKNRHSGPKHVSPYCCGALFTLRPSTLFVFAWPPVTGRSFITQTCSSAFQTMPELWNFLLYLHRGEI